MIMLMIDDNNNEYSAIIIFRIIWNINEMNSGLDLLNGTAFYYEFWTRFWRK